MNKTREKQLVKNTIIISIGKICTQFISFFLLPLYTIKLSTTEFGIIDLLNNYIALLIPIFFFQMDQGVFRFLIDARNKEIEKKNIISTSIITITFQAFFFVILYLLLSVFIKNNYKYFLLTNLIAAMYSSVLLQICRGIGDNKTYSIGCLISGVSAVILNVIFIVLLNLGANGVLLATFISNILCIVYVFIKEKIYQQLSFNNYINKTRRDIWKYSIPLVPNQLSWWVVNVSDRTIIKLFINTAANGIYAAANKISTICITFFNFFNMTWAESASMHIKDGDSDQFFSKIFNISLSLFGSLCVGIIAILPFAFKIIIPGSEYSSAYFQIPILIISTIFNIIVSLLGSIYVALKKSNEIAKTSIFAAIINILINLIFIRHIGLYAASISTVIAYLLMAIYRFIDIKKYIHISIDFKKLALLIFMFIIIVPSYYLKNIYVCIITLLICLFISIIININVIKTAYEFSKNKIINLLKK